ncbi:calcium/sodium antiporter [Kordiimonas gwangyangensis]|uniref:calcium/sodium antiporter n=1 Tax=Kordiimonas gwangyangensis TaxID=288022 RepID=UPI00035DAFCB|nr:calcium/sodium antiporter [Kordiimonas gwangyangensis]
MAYLQVVAGIVLLVVAGDFLVRGSVSLAMRAGISKLVIGLTIVAFGTSAPEMLVGVDAVLQGAPTLAIGNVVGSNIANALLVVGVPALLAPVACCAPKVGRNLAMMLIATALFIALSMDGKFAYMEGAILLVGLALFLGYSVMARKACPVEAAAQMAEMEELDRKPDGYGVALLCLFGGLAGLAIGADLLVIGSVQIATEFGIPEAVIGLTLVALGTSLPELVTCVMAAIRGHSDVAIGNVIGSNIFNILAIMGVAPLFGTIPVPETFLEVDLWVMLGSSLLLIPFVKIRKQVGRLGGIMMVALYIGYLVYLAHSTESAAVMGLTL